MGPTHVFDSMYGRVLTGAGAVVAAIMLVSITVTDGIGGLLRAAPWILLGVLAVAALFWLPRVVVSDGGIEIRNVWTTTRIPWPTFRAVEARYSLEVETTTGKVSAWAAPRSSGAAARMRRRGTADDTAPAVVDAGDPDTTVRHPGTADAAAAVIVARYGALKSAGHLAGAAQAVRAGGIAPVRTLHVRTLTAAGVLVVAGLLGVLIG